MEKISRSVWMVLVLLVVVSLGCAQLTLFSTVNYGEPEIEQAELGTEDEVITVKDLKEGAPSDITTTEITTIK